MKLIRSKTEATDQSRRSLRSSEEPTTSSSKFSYSSRRSEEAFNVGRQTERAKVRIAKTTSYWLQRFGVVILFIAVVASAINLLSLSNTPVILPLDSRYKSELSTQDELTYQKAAQSILASSILNSNKITVDTNGLASQLMNKYPQIADVSVTIPLTSHHPIVYIAPALPALILVENNGSFALASNGRAMAEASTPLALNLPNLPVVTDESGLKVQLEHQVLSSTVILFIQTVADQLAAKGFHISTMTLPAASAELDASIAGQPYFVKFNLETDDARQQAGTFLATINSLKSQGITPSKYVDVRVDGRAYYL